MVSLCPDKPIYAPPRLSKSSQRCFRKFRNIRLTDDSFHLSLAGAATTAIFGLLTAVQQSGNPRGYSPQYSKVAILEVTHRSTAKWQSSRLLTAVQQSGNPRGYSPQYSRVAILEVTHRHTTKWQSLRLLTAIQPSGNP